MKTVMIFMLLFLAVFGAEAVLTADSDLQEPERVEWQSWKREYGKDYASQSEEARAQAVWRRHAQFIKSHNSRSDVTFTVAMNEFADQEPRRKGFYHFLEPLLYTPEMNSNSVPRAPPASFDWRTKGAIPPVHNQGSIGRADVIVVTDDLESLHFINTGQLVTLSEQEVADCCSMPPGILVSNVYECIHNHGGLCSEGDYPPTGHTDCRNDSCIAAADDAKRTVHVPKGDEAAMVTALLQCPLVVYVDASRTSFQLYSAGVYRDSSCTGVLDHVMQLVGYGKEESGTAYWILKNSWGVNWGMEGYMLMERGTNMCGVANFAFYPQ